MEIKRFNNDREVVINLTQVEVENNTDFGRGLNIGRICVHTPDGKVATFFLEARLAGSKPELILTSKKKNGKETIKVAAADFLQPVTHAAQ